MIIPNSYRLILAFVFLAFLSATSLNAILPAVIYHSTYVGDREVLYGLMIASFPFGQCLGALFLPVFAEQIGYRNTLILSTLMALVCSTCFALILLKEEFFWAILLRFFHGCWEGNVALSRQFVVNNVNEEEQRNKKLAQISIAVTGGFLLGPIINGYSFSYLGKITIFLPSIYAILMLVLAIIIPKLSIDTHIKSNKLAPIVNLNMQARMLLLTCLAVYFATDVFYQYAPLFLTLKFNFNVTGIANLLFIISLTHILTSYISYLPRRYFNYKKILMVISCGFIVNIFIMNFLPPPALVFAFCMQGVIISLLSNNLTYFFTNLGNSLKELDVRTVVQHMVSSRAFVSGTSGLLASSIARIGIMWPFVFAVACLTLFIWIFKTLWIE